MADHKEKFPLLHSIRGVAALYVVVFHAKFILWSGGMAYTAKYPTSTWGVWDYFKFAIDMSSTAGKSMVMIFFVLSGFFITMSLENIKGTFRQRLKSFLIVRFVRIYIPYLASVAVAVLVLWGVHQWSPDLFESDAGREFNQRLIIAWNNFTLSNFLKSLVFMFDGEYIGYNFVYWSLFIESVFYLVIPFVSLRKTTYLIASVILFAFAPFVLYFFPQSHTSLIRFLFEYNFYFALGQFIYVYKDAILAKLEGKNYKRLLLAIAFVLYVAFDLCYLKKYFFMANFLAGITVFLLIVAFLKYDFKNTLFVKAIIKLGEISYSLYLVHLPVLLFLYCAVHVVTKDFFYYNRIWYITGVLLSIPIGFLFYIGVEKPSIKIISHLKRKIRK